MSAEKLEISDIELHELTLGQNSIACSCGARWTFANGDNGWNIHVENGLRATLAQVIHERDLAIAHDRQPYPTAWAYEQACRTIARLKTALEMIDSDTEHASGLRMRQIARRALDNMPLESAHG